MKQEKIVKAKLIELISGEDIASSLMLSKFCVDCYPKKYKDNRAYYTYKGNSLCEQHFVKRKKRWL